jgi:hypothetical protein
MELMMPGKRLSIKKHGIVTFLMFKRFKKLRPLCRQLVLSTHQQNQKISINQRSHSERVKARTTGNIVKNFAPLFKKCG